MVATDDNKLQELKSYMDICKEKEYPDSQLIAILHKAQALYGYLKRETMDEIAVHMNIPTAHIWGVATFYHYFNLKPVGKHIISVCLGTACYVKGAGKILDAIKRHLNIEVGETTEDKIFTLQEARCLGACGIAPVIMIDEKIYGELNEAKTIELLKKYEKIQ
ncbi:MAG: NADH-quinone oxidoreductase subunit NuoE [Candidatus Omnitrophica bacterium]|nr:NADH-quinone oxidoreductase subunit NuoE [Candidatus Omnitrophota bacterium]